MRVVTTQAELVPLGLLTAATLCVYAQVVGFDFVRTDDLAYVANNPRVLDGLSLSGAAWAWTSITESNWFPVTWLSFMLDVEIGGGQPWACHLTNLLLHGANTLLLYRIFRSMTGHRWRSFVVSLLFAVHPLHVESVAWIAERKDVLCTFFGCLALLGYLRYVGRPSAGSYLWVLLPFALGLMAKPMLVTLPFVLLLLDYWPLDRLRHGARGPLIEKIPLLLLSGASSAITFYAQSSGGAVAGIASHPIELRISNAALSYVGYIAKLFWPRPLGLEYPYRFDIPLASLLFAVALLAALSWLAVHWARRRPYWSVGWMWYLGTLVPVIGLVQVGQQPMADRYTYIPLIGLFIALAWGGNELLERLCAVDRTRRIAATALVSTVALALIGIANVQARTWSDSISLYEQALRISRRNLMAHTNLGAELQDRGRVGEAIRHYEEALGFDPGATEVRLNLAAALLQSGDGAGAVAEYRWAAEQSPDDPDVQVLLAIALQKTGQLESAEDHYVQALRLNSRSFLALKGLGTLMARRGRLGRAAADFRQALAIHPDDADTLTNLAIVLKRQSKLDDAAESLIEAIEIDPAHAVAWKILGQIRLAQGRREEGISSLSESLRLDPSQHAVQRRLNQLRTTSSSE